jgi:hypothetical protein
MARHAGRSAPYAPLSESFAETRPLSELVEDSDILSESPGRP